MTFDQLIGKYNNKFVEVAGSPNALNQCTDLANLYIRDVLGLPIIEWTNAVDFPSKAGDKYTWIPNTPMGIPQKSDIIIWKPSPGHIAIFFEGDVNRFSSFDQNFPLYSKCHLQEHDYYNVTGWLRPKNQPSTGSTATLEAKIVQLTLEKTQLWNDKNSLLNINKEIKPTLEGVIAKLKLS